MDKTFIIYILVGMAALLILFALVAASRIREKTIPNYRAMFVMGICFFPIAIASNHGLSVAGVVLILVSLKNKDKWGKQTRWADFPPVLKKIKVIVASGLATLSLFAIALFLF